MTSRIGFTPEAQQQLHDLDEWIAENAGAQTATRFMSALLDHIDEILVFPRAGRPRDDIRPGMRTVNFRKRTLIAYEVDQSSVDVVINVLGVFYGGQDWEATFVHAQSDPWAGDDRH